VSSGVTAADALDAGPAPAPFVADTVNVYAVPSANPDTTAEVTLPPLTDTGVCADEPMNGVIV